MGLDIDRVIEQDTVHSHLKCSICLDVLENPLQAPCQHTFCKQCISQWLNCGNNTCPEDRQRLSLSELKPPRIIQDLLIKLTIRCKNHEAGCRLLAKYEDMKKLIDHETNHCTVNNESCRKKIEDLKQINRHLKDEYQKMSLKLNGELESVMKNLLDVQKEIFDLSGINDSNRNMIMSLKRQLSEKEKEISNSSSASKLKKLDNETYEAKLQMPSENGNEGTILNLELPSKAIEVTLLSGNEITVRLVEILFYIEKKRKYK